MCRECNVVVSKYKRLRVSKERMHLRRGGSELAGIRADFFIFTLKRGCISEAGLENFRLITMVVWFTFFGFCFFVYFAPKLLSQVQQ